MEERLFFNESTKPNEQTLKAAFGNVYTHFKELMDISNSFSKDWNFSKSSGWMLKVHDKKKALFYLIPMKKEFKISMAIRDKEKNNFIKDIELKMIHGKLLSAKRYREGFALRFNTNDDDYETIEELIRKLITFRT